MQPSENATGFVAFQVPEGVRPNSLRASDVFGASAAEWSLDSSRSSVPTPALDALRPVSPDARLVVARNQTRVLGGGDAPNRSLATAQDMFRKRGASVRA